MKSLFVPWTLAQYLNGAHPLIVSVLDSLAGQVSIAGPQVNPMFDRSEFAAYYRRLEDEMQALTGVERDIVQRFVATRYHLSDAVAPPNSVGFHHTILPSLRYSSIVHFETPILFFWPEVSHGKFARGTSLVDHPFYPLIRASLAHLNIKKIVSHSATGLQYLRGLFPDPVIQDKTAYIPLMPFVQRSVERARQLPGGQPIPPTKGRRRILFTNSFHGESSSFWLRGGVTTLLAFHRVGAMIPLELVIVGLTPDDLPEEVMAIVRSPYVRQITRASESELQAYYDSADVMLLPSMGLHSMSITRAICSGCYVLCSDAPGAEEYVNDPAAGLILNGLARNRVYFDDAKASLLLDDYASVKQINVDNVDAVAEALHARLTAVPCRNQALSSSQYSDPHLMLRIAELFREVCAA
ncbi:MAG: glycosyltransferase [Nitrospira sp.]|jgi:glycosyltransferase involved in cell wall biosynthesis|nr:glycosyltransferase [Nitrospira sp.]